MHGPNLRTSSPKPPIKPPKPQTLNPKLEYRLGRWGSRGSGMAKSVLKKPRVQPVSHCKPDSCSQSCLRVPLSTSLMDISRCVWSTFFYRAPFQIWLLTMGYLTQAANADKLPTLRPSERHVCIQCSGSPEAKANRSSAQVQEEKEGPATKTLERAMMCRNFQGTMAFRRIPGMLGCRLPQRFRVLRTDPLHAVMTQIEVPSLRICLGESSHK